MLPVVLHALMLDVVVLTLLRKRVYLVDGLIGQLLYLSSTC